MNDIYERKLSGRNWVICLVLLGLGVVIWAGGCLVCLNQDVMLSVAIAAIAFVMMLTGVEGLIGQWSWNSLETLSKKEIRRGFGLMLIGGILSIIASLLGIILKQYENTPLWMLLGGSLVTVSAAICIGSYKKTEE